MKFKAIFLTAALAVAGSHAAGANEFEPALRDFADKQIRVWIADAKVVDAIKAQNQETGGLSEDKIVSLDKQWRAETSADSRPLIDSVMQRGISDFLRARKEEAQGVVTEIFVMDAKGLNVGQSDVTSDYWQGDEAKWKDTFLKGADAIHLGEVEQDESTQTFQSQISLSVVDPASGAVIGAVTVGVDVEALAQ
tara:strand:- start:897 stop:1478 length:582 start_codon:yes stop_codon:yes gene_type:complete